MWDHLLTAAALVLILEGLLPFLAPKAWLKMLREVSEARPVAVRIGGGLALFAGVVILQLVR